MKSLFNWACLIFLLLFSIEMLSLLSLFILEEHRGIKYEPIITKELFKQHNNIISEFIEGKTDYTVFSRELGWTIKNNGHSQLYRANSDGIRSDTEYQHQPPQGHVRIASFGDSYTHGDEVENKATWQSRMAELKPNLEVLNFGVGGYGLDQSYLRYKKDGIQFNPDIVFIGFMTENIFRSVNVFRPFYHKKTAGPLAKPRFIVKNNRLEIIENPIEAPESYKKILENPEEELPKLGKNDFYFRNESHEGSLDVFATVRFLKVMRDKYLVEKIFKNGFYNEDSEAFDITVRVFDEFIKTSLENETLPIILLFPFKGDMNRYGNFRVKTYQPLLNYFERKGYLYVDLMDAFNSLGNNYHVDDFFVEAHYSPLGNKIVADHLSSLLEKNDLLNKKTLQTKLRSYTDSIHTEH